MRRRDHRATTRTNSRSSVIATTNDRLSNRGAARDRQAGARAPIAVVSRSSLDRLQSTAGNSAVCHLLQTGTRSKDTDPSGAAVQRAAGGSALKGAMALAKRLMRSGGMRGSRLLARSAARRALRRLETFGIDTKVARHIAEHFTMIPEKVAHSLFDASLRNTKAVTGLVTETLKKGAAAPILSKTDTGALAWVFEADLGRRIGSAGTEALSKLRVVVDLKGRLITAFPIKSFTTTVAVRGLGGIRVTLQSALTIAAIQGVYEREAEAAVEARRRFDKENEPSWWEYLMPWGPSSTIGFEASPRTIRDRTAGMAAELEQILGEPLSSEARDQLENDVSDMW